MVILGLLFLFILFDVLIQIYHLVPHGWNNLIFVPVSNLRAKKLPGRWNFLESFFKWLFILSWVEGIRFLSCLVLILNNVVSCFVLRKLGSSVDMILYLWHLRLHLILALLLRVLFGYLYLLVALASFENLSSGWVNAIAVCNVLSHVFNLKLESFGNLVVFIFYGNTLEMETLAVFSGLVSQEFNGIAKGHNELVVVGISRLISVD